MNNYQRVATDLGDTTLRCPWSADDQDAARAEGWDIFWNDGVFPEIQYTQDWPSPFSYDAEANAHVLVKAMEGSVLHQRAVAHIAEFWGNASRFHFRGCIEERMARHCCSAA
ncbi:hypothetical protein [uncultured Methylobacterium sp.]|jgi:hypothetical protein|uniref:hypothetical protein n=1 Tax=uncultured Methylobacterium sp. TaxID=157278 RepID=UPI00260C2629|nr:hypothetical protein [uncultured Methylobacterium sp.]